MARYTKSILNPPNIFQLKNNFVSISKRVKTFAHFTFFIYFRSPPLDDKANCYDVPFELAPTHNTT